MGVEDRDWYHDRKKQKPINPDWKREYNRWYGRPNTPRPKRRLPLAIRLMCWAIALIAFNIAAKNAGLYDRAQAMFATKVQPTQQASAPPEPQHDPSTAKPQQSAAQITLYKCEERGRTIYTQTPCEKPIVTTITESAPAQQIRQPEDSAAATRRYEEELAKKWDARMAQRDRDIAAEQAMVQSQINVVNAQCNQLRAQRDSIQRMPLPYQQTSPWRDQMNSVRTQMSALHC